MQGGRTRHRQQDARLGVEFGEHDAVAEDVSQNVLDVVGCAGSRARRRGSRGIGSRRGLFLYQRVRCRCDRRCGCRRWNLRWARHRSGCRIRGRNRGLSSCSGRRCKVYGRSAAHGRCLCRRSVGGHIKRRKVIFGVVECSSIVVGNLVIDRSRLDETTRRRWSMLGRGCYRSGKLRRGRGGRRRYLRSDERGGARRRERCGRGLRRRDGRSCGRGLRRRSGRRRHRARGGLHLSHHIVQHAHAENGGNLRLHDALRIGATEHRNREVRACGERDRERFAIVRHGAGTQQKRSARGLRRCHKTHNLVPFALQLTGIAHGSSCRRLRRRRGGGGSRSSRGRGGGSSRSSRGRHGGRTNGLSLRCRGLRSSRDG